MKQLITSLLFASCIAAQAKPFVDFRHKPPKWQTAICLPDDSQKTLVNNRGQLLYDYRDGTRFNLTIGVVIPGVKRIEQRLVAPRIPIVKTTWKGDNLKVVQYAFATTDKLTTPNQHPFAREEAYKVLRSWAHVPQTVNQLLGNTIINETGPLRFRMAVNPGFSKCIALAVSEGFWEKEGMRIQTMRVEGTPAKTIDTIKNIGKNATRAFWFDAADVDNNGYISIQIKGKRGAVVSALWAFAPGVDHNSKALLTGELDKAADAISYAADKDIPVPRCDAIRVKVTNTSRVPAHVTPSIVINSISPVQYNWANGTLYTGSHDRIRSSIPLDSTETYRTRHMVSCKGFELLPGKSHQFDVTRVIGSDANASVSLAQAINFWKTASIPYDRITVPDKQIQALIDSSIRNIWQAREIKGGLPVFQVGPTCYRNLWIVDAAFILETAAMLGKWQDARQGIEHILSHQQEEGQFELIKCNHKENGIVLWTCLRHAQLTRDKKWLLSVWPKLKRTIGYIMSLRKQALTNDTPLDNGLIPAGFPDGGLACRDLPELSNSFWCLIGLKAAVDAARWIGKDATPLQQEFDLFMSAFRKVSKREMKGKCYLPILMESNDVAPEKAQWTFLHAIHPGKLFTQDAPLINANLAMLKATEKQGMVVNTGWLQGGIWTYFASFYAHAWLQQGNSRKASQCLYAMAHHAAPTLVWQEEQPLDGQRYRRIGDMPHNWASAEFIRLTVHLLAFERDDELHLLEGLPLEWLNSNMTTTLDGVLTKFGPLTMSLVVSEDGKVARLCVNKLAPSCEAIIVHLPSGKRQSLKANVDHSIEFETGM